MDFGIKTATVSTSGNIFKWGGCFSENGLFLLLEVEGGEEQHAAQKGRQIMDLLLTKFTDEKERNLDLVKKLLNEVKNDSSIKTITLGIASGSILYLGNIGEGEVLLRRKDTIGKILASGGSSSGRIEMGDMLLFSSKTFCQSIPKEERDKILATANLQNGAEVGSSQLLKTADAAGAIALIVAITSLPERVKVSQPLAKFHQRWQTLISKIKPRKTVWGDESEVKSKKTLLTISVILIALLIFSIFLNIGHTRSAKLQKQYSQTLDLVSHQYEEAVSLIDLNPARARTLLSDSKLSLAPLLSQFSKNSNEYKEISDWLGKIAEKEVAAYKIYKLTQVPLFFDINLIKQGGVGSKITGYKTLKAILDTGNNVVYSLTTDKKQAAIAAGTEAAKDIKTVDVHGKTIYILADSGIVGVDISSKSSRVVIKKDNEWGEIATLSAFGGNLYLLDKTYHTIWKYIATEGGFLGKTRYLNPDVRVNFSQSLQMVIDSSVWVLLTEGEILKFTNGLGEPFAFKGFPENMSQISRFSTSDEDENLYLLDKGANRIIVFEKDGTYKSQYQWEELKNAQDLIASEDENKIFILMGSKIYAIDIK
jgi:hypothetical protein